MKTTTRKVPRSFKLDSKINAALRDRASVTGISETRIVEDSLQEYLNRGMAKKLTEGVASFKKVTTSSMWGREWVSPVLSPVV